MKIAVLMPTYNGVDTIEFALQSLMATQPHIHKLEAVYLVDDHSTDDTISRAMGCWISEVPLRLHTTPQNQGLYANHNYGISQMIKDGIEWILILHQDDYVDPTWLELLQSNIAACDKNTVAIRSAYIGFTENSISLSGIPPQGSQPTVLHGTPENVKGTVRQGGWCLVSGCAFRANVFTENGFFDDSLPHMADWEWTLRAFAGGFNIVFEPRVIMAWRQHAASYSAASMRTLQYVEERITVLKRYTHFLNKSDILKWYSREIFYACKRLGRAILIRNPAYMQTNVRALALLLKSGGTLYFATSL